MNSAWEQLKSLRHNGNQPHEIFAKQSLSTFGFGTKKLFGEKAIIERKLLCLLMLKPVDLSSFLTTQGKAFLKAVRTIRKALQTIEMDFKGLILRKFYLIHHKLFKSWKGQLV